MKISNFKSQFQIISAMFFLVLLSSCEAQNTSEKINGISLVASREKISANDIQPIKKVNANTVALMPFGFMESLNSPKLYFNLERQWWGEREEGIKESIELMRKDSLEVMLKPQIWVRNGEFTGDVKMNSEAEWVSFEEVYEEFILLYAKIAESEKVEILCIGTELHEFVNARPDFWNKLIADLRNVYSGKLTYAENWDKMDKVEFWEALDYVGVDAYFPLNVERSPKIEELRKGWKPYKNSLKIISETSGKPILFTEYGYRNIDFAAKTPWDSSRELKDTNNKLQADALEALYQEFWQEDWFAGGFLWKWHHNHAVAGGDKDTQFTPQNKPAEQVVKNYYGRVFTN